MLDSYDYKYSLLIFKNEIAYLKKKNTYRKNILFEYNNFRHNIFVTVEDLLEKETNPNIKSEKLNNFNYWFSLESESDDDNDDADIFSEKTIEGHRKFKLLINENRNMLREVYKLKSPRQYMFNRKFMYLFKKEALFFVQTLEFNIVNLTLRSGLFINEKFFSFFLDKKGVYVNGINIKNKNTVLKLYDRVEFQLTKYNFILYKKSIENIFLLDKKAQDKV